MSQQNPLEDTVKANVRRRLRKRGGHVITLQAIRGRGVKGQPDTVGSYPLRTLGAGAFVAAECKRPKGSRIDATQIAQLTEIARAGAVAAIVKSGPAMDALLDAIDSWDAGWTESGPPRGLPLQDFVCDEIKRRDGRDLHPPDVPTVILP